MAKNNKKRKEIRKFAFLRLIPRLNVITEPIMNENFKKYYFYPFNKVTTLS